MTADERYYADCRAAKAAEFSEICRDLRSAPDFRTPHEELIDRYELESGETYRPNRRTTEDDDQ